MPPTTIQPGRLLRRRRLAERYSLRTLSKAIGGIAGKDRISMIERGLLAPHQVRVEEARAFHQVLGLPIEIWQRDSPPPRDPG